MAVDTESKKTCWSFQPSPKEQSQGKNDMLYANALRNYYLSQQS